MLTKAVYEKNWRDFDVEACVYFTPKTQAYVLADRDEEHYGEGRYRVMFTYPKESNPEERFYYKAWGGYRDIAIAATANEVVGLCPRAQDTIYSYDKDRDGFEEPIPSALPGTDMTASMRNIRNIDGVLYTVGWPRRAYKRQAMNEWVNLTDSIPIAKDCLNQEKILEYQWNDIDGHHEHDLYTVGNDGNFWHSDGEVWHQKDCPIKGDLLQVCCAGNEVFVSHRRNTLAPFRNLWRVDSAENWVEVEGVTSVRNMVFFRGELYLSEPLGVLKYNGHSCERLQGVPLVARNASAINVSPDQSTMLVTGSQGIAMFDGEAWEILFDRDDI